MNNRVYPFTPLIRDLILGGLLAVCGCDQPSAGGSAQPVAEQPAPTLTGVDLHGQPVDLADLSGKVVLVDFWATWCEPCEQAMPALAKLATEFGDQLVIIGVSVDEDPSKIQAFVDRVGINFTVVHDHDQTIARRWSPPKMPTTFVIDQHGVVARIHDSYGTDTAASLRADIAGLLGR